MNTARNKKTGIILLLIIIFTVLYFLSTPRKTDNSPIIIGFIGPLSSEVSDKGRQAKAAVELAVDEINESGGVDDRVLEVIYKDGGCDSAMAHEAARDLIQNHEVSAILGGACSHETLAFTDMAEQSKTVVLSYCSTAPEISHAGNYIFRTNPSSVGHAYFDAKYVKKVMGKSRAAILYVNAPWGRGLMETFSEAFIKNGGEIVAQESHMLNDTDMSKQIATIQAAEPDMLYFLGYAKESIIGLKQIQETELNIPILGGSTWDNPSVWQEAGSTDKDILYSISFSPLSGSFRNNMRDRFGIDTVLECVPQAYDGINILSQVIDKVGTDSEKIKNELYRTVYNSGISSNQIRFDENGDVINTTYLIKRVRGGRAEEVEYYRTDQHGEFIQEDQDRVV